jgi:hypothetical protein
MMAQPPSHAYRLLPERQIMQHDLIDQDRAGMQHAAQAYAQSHTLSQKYALPSGSQMPQASAGPQTELSPKLIAAIARAMGQHGPTLATSVLPARRYFSKMITNATSELPMSVIKELKSGFKNYIPLALCTH